MKPYSLRHAVEMIREICGSLLSAHSSWEKHRCSRCNLPLTDFSSIQRGKGAICANKDTALFAKTIKANYLFVVAKSEQVEFLKLPEIARPVWAIWKENIIPAMSAAVSKTKDLMSFEHDGNDMRDFVRIADWILSLPNVESKTRKLLIDIVRHLGYVAVASVMEGKASTGESKIWFDKEAGMLCLQGSACKPGFLAMRELDGVKTPRYRGDKTHYQVPARHHLEFSEIAVTYWPLFEQKLESVTEEAVAWLKEQSKKQVSLPVNRNDQKPTVNKFVTFLQAKDGIEFTMVWEQERTLKVVSDIKGIPYKFRRYNPSSRSWFVGDKYKFRAMEILVSHYGEGL